MTGKTTLVNLQKLYALEKAINTQVKIDKKRIIPYSAKKIRANFILPYSILNPDTNSDSLSAKSKGARFVSATPVYNHKTTLGISANPKKTLYSSLLMKEKFNLEEAHTKLIAKKANEISQEIDCAIPRALPIKAYDLFEPHPLKNKGYTFQLNTETMNTKLNTPQPPISLKGKTDTINKNKNKDNKGEIR